jgi:VanZ family protein
VTASLRVWRAAAVAWAAVILASGLLPTQDVIEAASRGRDDAVTTAGHFAAYVLLGFLVGVALAGWEVRAGSLLLGLALSAALGGLVELVQAPLPYRSAEMMDLIVDVAGAAVGLVLFSAVPPAERSRWRRG